MNKHLHVMQIGSLEVFMRTDEAGVFWRDSRYETIGHGPFVDRLDALNDYAAVTKARNASYTIPALPPPPPPADNVVFLDFKAKRRLF